MTTPSVYPVLTVLRHRLASEAGIVNCRVGIEANMTPADYPMVRIVPSKVSYAAVLGRRKVDCLVYFGTPVHEFSAGLEALYADLLALEALLVDAATSGGAYYCEYLETVADEDRVDGFKLMAMRVVVEG